MRSNVDHLPVIQHDELARVRQTLDAMRGPVPHYAALDYISDAQRRAFGFLGLTADVLRAEDRAANG